MIATPERLDGMPLGIIEGEPNDVYHAREALSFSKLKVFMRCPLEFRAVYVDRTRPRQQSTKAMALGSALHAVRDETFNEQFVVLPPDVERLTQKIRDQHPGKTVIKHADGQTLRAMVDSAAAHPALSALTAGCKREVTFRAVVGGMVMQCRADNWGVDKVEFPSRICGMDTCTARVVDLKKCNTLEGRGAGCFASQVWDLEYYLQAAFYLALIRDCVPTDLTPDGIRWFFCAVEEEYPHQCQVMEFDPMTLDLAHRVVMHHVKALRTCIKTGVWPTAPKEVVTLSAPEWLQKKAEFLGIT